MPRLGISLLIAILLVTAGCGQKGPLYLPDDDEAAERYDPQGNDDNQDDADGN
ncbi:LPS translocon maturation chaperone LptM [Aidingimonas lacisalsi]|uniref:LPS translocon maturation chaperone LptM n=1 Tax=Aidingimonas lacisalsi TaxID=2604086 RepID=UPI0011D22807|nr:lipoprotein [Aidingimonas lacisalsi]